MKLLLLFSLACFCFLARAQPNLVPNWSFEEKDDCPSFVGDFAPVSFWIDPNWGSADYYNWCDTTNTVGVPSNVGGYQNAHTGDAYVGIATYHWATREYVQAEFISPMIPQKRYEVEFYVSLPDSSNYASNEMGAYLSVNPISNTGGDPFLVTPQITNPLSNNLDDKVNWMKISGEFIAVGGEQYITIGNFKSNANTVVDSLANGGVTWTEVLTYY
jgi:OOP family OmpA-OmpF porin